MKFSSVIFVVVLFSCVGCASISEYNDSNQSLTFGLVEAYENGYHESVWTLGHSRRTSEIRIEITHIDTNAKYVLNTGIDGFFFSTTLPHGKYRLNNLSYYISQNN